MYIHGEFENLNGDTVEVHFLKGSMSGEYIIGGADSGIQFGADPVVVSVDGNDTFNPIVTSTCTITLLTDHYIGDLLFANNARDIKVAVIGGHGDFFGYVEPCAFTQPFSKEWEEVQITCLDPLAALQYITPLTGGETYDHLIRNASVKSFADFIEDMGLHEQLDFVRNGAQPPSLFFDGSVTLPDGNGNILDEIGISESLFLGDDEDEVMTYEEILTEILQYLNLHIRCVNGHFYLYNYDNVRFSNQIQFTNIFNTLNSFPNPVVRHTVVEEDYAGDDTTFSMAEVFNQITVTCETTPIDTVIEDPFNEDDLKAIFPKKSHFMREWVSEGKSDEDLYKFMGLIHGSFGTADYSNCWWRDWYVQFYHNKKWTLNNPYYTDLNANGDGYIARNYEQWELLQHGKVLNYMPSFVAFGNSGKQTLQDNSPASDVSMTKCLYISVNGDFDNSEEGLDWTTAQLQNRTPVMTYESGKAVMLSPLDEDTTNYLVFSGNMVFVPIMQKTGQSRNSGRRVNSTPYERANLIFNDVYNMTWTDYFNGFGNDNYHKIRTSEGWVDYSNKAFYQQQFLKEGVWDSSLNYTEYNYPFISEYKGEELDYDHSTNPLNNQFDNVKKVPILECRLKVGDKYCVETFDNDGNSVFQWLPLEECPTYVDEDNTTKVHNTFSLGFDPAVGDKIIGKKWPIATNFDVQTNIDASEGTAIPIHASDNLTGEVQFAVVGVINATWEQVVRRHPTWFRHTSYHNTTKSILHNMHAIQIDGFECKVYSDNAKLDNNGDNDLIYYSSEQTTFIEKKDDITFKLNTALTSQEAHDLGVKNEVNLSSVVRMDTGAFIDTVTNTIFVIHAKPEELYVQSKWNEFNTPKMIVDTTLHATASPFSRYNFSYLPNKWFIPLSEEYSYLYGTHKLKLKEVGTWS